MTCAKNIFDNDDNDNSNNIKLSILLVEDDASILEILEDFILEIAKDIELDIASNGYLALEKIRQNKYDLLITDFDLPIVNGMDLLKALKSVNRDFQPKAVVLLSNYVGPGEPAPNLRFVNYIPKNDYQTLLKEYILTRIAIKRSRIEGNKQILEDMRSSGVRVTPDYSEPIRVDIIKDEQVDIVRAKDISLNGISLYVSAIDSTNIINTTLECIISLPRKKPFKVTATLKHIGSNDQYYLGLEFKKISEDAKEEIRKYIFKRLQESRD
ncbi:MAG: response regulator [Oligoflexia bacterium]|nr:response regulator [Oligoflexia bacterium]